MSALSQPVVQRSGIERRTRVRVISTICLVIIVCGLVLLSAMVGQYRVEAADVIKIVFGRSATDAMAESVLWQIRFPRIVLGLLVGASLAVAGAVMQALFSNPLAEPGVIGVSSGAAVGASIMIVVAPNFLSGFGVPAAAFVSGLLAASSVYIMARSGRRAESTTLVLTGIAVTAVCSAITSISTYVAPTTARDQIVFWQMGSLSGTTWSHVATVGTVASVGVVWAILIAGKLDTLALGERAAGHLGVNVNRLRLSSIALTALLTSAAVAYAGVITFVGLIVPHVLRLLIGPANKWLIPSALLGGCLLVTLSDIAARTVVPYADLPIGIFTAIVGGPTFFILLRRGMGGEKALG
ncbi:FecCD family ABC transporter permease [Cutibacterium acnes]|uniref:FecCD family ABC transporter permease n=1 Tax=Cutibacterium acnes TaxID=1747 RepID=UPI00085A48CA|nr:iron ABC transporter permease [Cutibacterium acnes]OEU36383.1 ABC transporter permease [Cutibacterium acnes]